MGWLYCLSVLFTLVFCVSAVRVHTQLGGIEGEEYITHTGKHVYTFLGVPYAQPPIGQDRFEEPKPLNAWNGVWQAKKQRPSCAQFSSLIIDDPEKITGDENCLYLNVYTPNVTKSSSLPVLVYIHGGAFMMGSSAGFKPDFLLEHIDLVFVSLNYRLGPFGFLSTEDEVVPGNNGLKDQMFALKWIQENIEVFGGNKDAVTISGNSAGGASVQYHYLSPLSRGLFHRGISSSGSSLMPWAFTEEPLQKAKKLADALGCETDTTRNMVKCLKGKPSQDILSKIEPLFMPWLYNPFSPFGPVIEKNAKSPFLSKHPYNLLKSGEVFQAPWLASITTEEGLYPAASFITREDYMKSLDTEWLLIAPHLLDYNFTAPENKKNYISNKVRKAYLGNKQISTHTANKVIKMLGDRMFKVDMDYATRIQASVTPFPVFLLTFGFRGSVSLSNVMSKTTTNYGVSHFDDIYFVLAMDDSFKMTSNIEMSVIKTMSEIWSSFIKNGLPSISDNIQWNPIPRESALSGNVSYLSIDSKGEMTMKTDDNYGNKRFWVSLGLNENEHYK